MAVQKNRRPSMMSFPTIPGRNQEHRCFVLFSTTSSLLSRTIRWATSSRISHAAIAYECATTGRVLVLEASGDGFRSLTWERWIASNELIHLFRVDVPTAQWRGALGEFCDTLGAPYDVRRLALEVARHFSRGWTQRFAWADPTRGSHGVLCSDAVADFLRRLGLDEFDRPSEWTPAALLAHLQASESFVAERFAGTSRMTLREKCEPAPLAAPLLKVVA
jgi:hypothetical protein